jgi:hypothetical protein
VPQRTVSTPRPPDDGLNSRFTMLFFH